MKKYLILVSSLLCASMSLALAQNIQKIDLKPEKFESYGIQATPETYKGRIGLRAEQTATTDSDKKFTFLKLKDLDFHNGTIEIFLSGQTKKDAPADARGFVGVQFRLSDDTTKFELFYLRPTNGRANDQVRRNHSLQYVSHPEFHWRKLRKEFPEKYESYADLVPGEWTQVKIEVKDETAKLYINGATQPNLIVNDLKHGKDQKGSIGLWLDIGTLAHFADLKVTKLD